MTMLPLAMLLQGANETSFLENLTVANILKIGLLLTVVWLAIKGTERLLELLSGRVSRARFFFKRLGPIVRISLWFTAIFVTIEILSPTPNAFVAGIASVGIALGLGAQDLVKNVIGGLIVLMDRPYQLGDRVKMGDAYGEIDHIGLRSTKLTTPDDTRVTIPNADVMTSHIFEEACRGAAGGSVRSGALHAIAYQGLRLRPSLRAGDAERSDHPGQARVP